MSEKRLRILGLDPGLQKTGWGLIDSVGNRLIHVANGIIKTNAKLDLSQRLVELHEGLNDVLAEFEPDEAAVEETFVNKNPASALKLGMARGVVLMTPRHFGLYVGEYPANLVKKSVVGAGHASKEQVQMMIKTLLPGVDLAGEDAADALAVAICHLHHRVTKMKLGGVMAGGAR